jgi:excisionase family DNA binding protein
MQDVPSRGFNIREEKQMTAPADRAPIQCLLTLQEAADFLQVSKITVRRWTRKGQLGCVRFGTRRDRRFYLEDLERFIHITAQHGEDGG